MGIALNDEIRRLLDGRHFAVLATINPDGGPQTSAMWVGRDGDDVLFSTVRGRKKTRNMERDPRVSVCAYDPAQPYSYFTVEGAVTLTEEGGDELINELSHKYDGRPYTFDAPGTVRVVCRLTPTKVISS